MNESTKVSEFSAPNSEPLIKEFKPFDNNYVKSTLQSASASSFDYHIGNKHVSMVQSFSYGNIKDPFSFVHEKINSFSDHHHGDPDVTLPQRHFQIKNTFDPKQQLHSNLQDKFPNFKSSLNRQTQLSRSMSENKSLVSYYENYFSRDNQEKLSLARNTFASNFGLSSAISNTDFKDKESYIVEQPGQNIADSFHASPRSLLGRNNLLSQRNNPIGLNDDIISQENQPAASQDIAEMCSRHGDQLGYFYCRDCDLVLCSMCLMDEVCACHEYIDLQSLHSNQSDELKNCEVKIRNQLIKIQDSDDLIERLRVQLRKKYEETIKSVEKTHAFFLQVLQDRKEELFSDLEEIYVTKVNRFHEIKSTVSNNIIELNDAVVLIDTLTPLPFSSKLVPLKSEVVQKIEDLVNFRVELKELNDAVANLNFYSNRQMIKSTIKNAFGFVGSIAIGDRSECLESRLTHSSNSLPANPIINNELSLLNSKTFRYNAPIARPLSDNRVQISRVEARKEANTTHPRLSINSTSNSDVFNPMKQSKLLRSQSACPSPSVETNKSDSLSTRSSIFQEQQSAGSTHNLLVGGNLGGFSADELSKSIFPINNVGIEMLRIKMEYHCKFGEFGSEPGQFTEPSGVAVGRDNEIFVADANNHRIQAFDCSGAFKRIIGHDLSRSNHEGKGQDGSDLVYPNRLVVNKATGDIYVTERSPTHQVRVYDDRGRFVRRFGSQVLQHPRGITVDVLGRVVVVECKVMRVVIFNSIGSVLNRFTIEKKVNFPNGVAVNDREEIFISDNRRHGIVVFDYHGTFLRTIGGIGVTNYPIGVGINSSGEVVVADNHNNFNVTLFTQEGKLIRALESRVKHAQCFDTALMGEGSIIVSSKDFRIYVYHYASHQQDGIFD